MKQIQIFSLYQLVSINLLYQRLKNRWLVALLEAMAHWLLGLYLAKRRDHLIFLALEASLQDWMPAYQPGVPQGGEANHWQLLRH